MHTMDRTFISTGPRPLERAAQQFAERIQQEPGPWWFVVPARRGVRQFNAALARFLPPELEPPRGIPQGAWLDALRPASKPAIDRREAIHVWRESLSQWNHADFLRAFGQERPAPDAVQAWWNLGLRARDLHADISQAGLDFEALAKAMPGQKVRWGLWQQALQHYASQLSEAGLCDGLMERAVAPLLPGVRVAFVFVPSASALERRTLQELDGRAHALVLAEPDSAGYFDEMGLLNPEAWSDRSMRLPLEHWYVETTPRDQAARAQDLLREWSTADLESGPLSAQDVVLSAPDGEVKPYLQRSLQSAGLLLRDGAGTDLGESGPALLLQAASRALPEFRFQESARFLRHPDLARALVRDTQGAEIQGAEAGVVDVAAVLDAYHERHLPMRIAEPLHSDRANARPMRALMECLREGLGSLVELESKPLPAWAEPLREFLDWVYGDLVCDPASPSDRLIEATLTALGAILNDWQWKPRTWYPQADGAGALTLLVGELAGQKLAPQGPAHPETELELLGWHELLWDDSRALIVTGFHEGSLPEAVPDDSLLAPAMRRSLGLPEGESRLIRDVYLMTSLLACREHVAWIGGRVSADNNPLRPSRLAFFRPEDEIPDALRHAFPSKESESAPLPDAEKAPVRNLPMLAQSLPLKRISVTDFGRYLSSPYMYYLERLLKLENVDDRERELNPRSFGDLLHGVMEDFAESDARHSTEEDEILEALQASLRRRTVNLFASSAMPAVQLQVQGMRRRLLWVAQTQAAWARLGWRIVATEWSPSSQGLTLGPPGAEVPLIGRVDRIDRHPEKGYAILDIKTGDKAKNPETEHRSRDGAWRNLQLPLYTLLAQELTGKEPVRVGYFSVGKDPESVRIQCAQWDGPTIDEAIEHGRQIVGQIQAGAFGLGDRARSYDPVMQAILGENLAGVQADGEEGEESA